MSNLADEIQQTVPFSSKEEEVFLNLQRTAYELRHKNEAVLKEHGLTSQQYNVLRILRGAGAEGLACSDISQRMVFNDSDITRLLSRLAKRNLIQTGQDKEDRRVKISSITKDGLELLLKLDKPVRKTVVGRLNHLGSDMLEQLNALLVLARNKN